MVSVSIEFEYQKDIEVEFLENDEPITTSAANVRGHNHPQLSTPMLSQLTTSSRNSPIIRQQIRGRRSFLPCDPRDCQNLPHRIHHPLSAIRPRPKSMQRIQSCEAAIILGTSYLEEEVAVPNPSGRYLLSPRIYLHFYSTSLCNM